jgi:DNA replication protein DnaC
MMTRCPECGSEVVLDTAGAGDGPFTRRLADLVVHCSSCADELDRLEEDVRRRAAVDLRRRAADLPASLRDQAFDGFSHFAAEAAAKRWAIEGGGLCLYGPVGVGKTRLAAAACWAALEQRPVRWISVPRLLVRVRSSFDDASRAEAIRVVAGRTAVVLDDLDKASSTDFGREILFPCVDERVEAGAPLLVTTNLRLSELGERYGDWIMSRLAGYCEVFEMAGADRRLEVAA